VTSKTGGTTKHIQKTACIQSSISVKTSQAYTYCQDKQLDGVAQQLIQYHHLECYIDILKQDACTGLFMFESFRVFTA
jgi:hypothetical protein